MLDLRGYVLLPEYGIDEFDCLTVSKAEIKELRWRISELADRRIGICSEHIHNSETIIFLAGFSNHGHHALEAVEEIATLLRPFESKLIGQFKVHIFAHDDERERTVTLNLGTPFNHLA